ncbi:MAG: restriction endonuclease subunit S [Flavobacteriales bacterium]|nr:restriction endonuclease subunit S [Flavobacteriales bacterium]
MEVIKPYEKYKDSGISWLGEIPEHWKVSKAKHILFQKKKTLNPDLNCGSISFGKIVFKDNDRVPFETKATYQELLKGEFLINPLNLNFDLKSLRTGLSRIDVVVSTGYIVLQKNSTFNENYLKWLLHQFDVSFMKTLGDGVRQTLSYTEFKNTDLPYISVPEQTAIANFLDYKTAKIDGFIFKKKQLIKLLNEQKAAIINDAVTKGLNPNAKMKPSGIEWLGDIPEHWEVRKLKYLGKFQNGISAGAEYFGSGFPFINYGDVYKNFELPKISSGLANSSEQDRQNYSVRQGDVFFTRTSETIEEIGYTSTCFSTIEDATFSGFLIRFRPYSDLLFEGFSKYYFRSNLHRRFFVKEMNLVIRASLSQELLKRMPVLLPTIDEQILIAKYIEKETAIINKTIATIEKEIALVQEYRTALIAEAVTGKIDLREYNLPFFEVNKEYAEIQEEMGLVAEEEINLD